MTTPRRLAPDIVIAAIVAVVASVAGTASAGTSAARPVTIFAPYRGGDAKIFLADVGTWASREGIDLRYTGTGDLANDLRFRVANADPPDIALVPQPGLVRELFESGEIRPLAPAVERAVRRNLGDGARALGDVDGVQAGFPYRVNAKGMVWYRPSVLEAMGLSPPRTLTELSRLVDRISDRGDRPWCFGIEAEGATGWPATDWVENFIVRDWGPDVYADWVGGVIPFSDPRIAASFERFRALVLAPGRLAGGVARAIATPVETASAPLFDDPPGCVLYQQASFALGWFPGDQTVGRDGTLDFFVLPTDSGEGSPIVVGADLVVAFDGRPEVEAVMKYLASPAATRSWVRAGGFITPQLRIPLDAYANRGDRLAVEQILDADVLVVDGSDAMPPGLGTDLFWDRITKWVAGTISYDELAADLDAAPR